MSPNDGGDERLKVARALLKADGTLREPRLALGDRELMVGERVISTRESEVLGMRAGTQGTVERIDEVHCDARIDFATWGRLELSVTQMLEAGIAHDYVAHDGAVETQGLDVGESLAAEAIRIDPGAGW